MGEWRSHDQEAKMTNQRLLGIEDIRGLTGPEKIADLFRRLGYNTCGEEFDPEDVGLSDRHGEAVEKAYLIAQQDNGDPDLKVLLFQLRPEEWQEDSTASSRLKAIANQLGQQSTEFLLMATTDYNQLMLVNPRKAFDDNKNIKRHIRKLLIDRTNPTAFDRDRLEALAVNGKSPSQLYHAHCQAFDVEQLTKSFYRGYRDLFERLKAVVMEYNPHPYFEDADRLHQFSQRLLGRLMFLYFLQKKEFLAGDRQFLSHQYRRKRFQSEDCDYYQDILEPLFFDTLNRQRLNCKSTWGKIPYLNGGLFDRDYGEGIRDAAGRETPSAVRLPNSLFDPGDTDSILSFFNGYNFTVAENVAGDEDVAVDPEMLGKVFENMLEVEERGKSGTFYTPRGIVQFMCSEVLCRYLADETGMELETVRKLIDYDPNLTDSDLHQLMSSQQVRSLKKALDNIKVLDPAVGSGAFPLGMLQIILKVKQAIARREGMTVKRGSLTISQWKREIIANNLYGVDIKPEAIEIAKLRMWLSLVVDIPSIEDVEPLPNLDYKLMCGNSLISTIHGEQLIPDPTKDQQGMLAITPIQTAIQPLLALQKQYFDAQTEERYQLREQILQAEMNVFRVAVQDRIQCLQGELKECDRKIKAFPKPPKALLSQRENLTQRITDITDFHEKVVTGKVSLNFFQYHLHFRDVFEEKGGFDVVIGNPPYVDSETMKRNQPEIRETYSSSFESAKGNWDIFVVFIEQGIKLLKRQGLISYIVPNKFMGARYAEEIRKFVINFQLLVIRDYSSVDVFKEADVYPVVFILEKTVSPISNKKNVLMSAMNGLEIIKEKNIVKPSIFYKDTYWDIYCLPRETYSIFEKLLKMPQLSQFFANIKGAATVNEAYSIKKIIKEYSDVNWADDFYKLVNTGTIDKYVSLWSKKKTKYIKSNYIAPVVSGVDLYRISPARKQDASSHKIIIAGMVKILECIYDEGEYLAGKSTTLILGDEDNNLKIGTALINSKLISFWYTNYYNSLKMAGGYINVNSNEIKKIPCPRELFMQSSKSRCQIINFVDKILQVKQSNFKTDTSQVETEIDKLVYQLYGLTEEEIAIVENST